jgi:hypothetical protein
MKKLTFLIALLLLLSNPIFTQVAVNSDGTTADPSAMLDVKSTSKGLLLPRMTTSQINAISTPAEGLMVYNTSLHSLVIYDGTGWKRTDDQFYIGANYGGGIIFYIDGTGQHVLISSLSDQSAGAQWGCPCMSIPGTSTTIGAGQDNTMAIVNWCSTTGIAARICDDLVLNGYDDWFLPSKDELNQMYQQKTVIGGFSSDWYWSSSEGTTIGSDSYAWVQDFSIGTQDDLWKAFTFHVRAIRAFSMENQPPAITTTAITNLTSNSVTTGGNVTSDGGSTVTARGICLSTTPNPTTANFTTNDGSGTGSFVTNFSGLIINTTYYIRAYATNSIKTAYGNQVSFTTHFVIGQSYGGGIIFYIDGTGQHGLIAATSDQSTGAPYGCWLTQIGASGTAIGTGQANTNLIVSHCGTGTAAQVCDALVLNSYSDWFLPSKDELNQMYIQSNVIGGFCTGCRYWSSSESSAANAWYTFMGNGSQATQQKDTQGGMGVRAVRSF